MKLHRKAITEAAWLAEKLSVYPYECETHYLGVPRDIDADFVWIPNRKDGAALYLFKDEAARDAFAQKHAKDRAA